jgi:hypothetical protein
MEQAQMTKTRYVSYDIDQANDHSALRAFVKRHNGQAVTKSLYRFETEMPLPDFRSELGKASGGDESVFLIVRTRESIAHGRAAPRRRARSAL